MLLISAWPLAAAAGLEAGDDLPLATVPLDVEVAERTAGTRILVASAEATTLLDATGAELGSLAGAADLVLLDVSGDGPLDVVTCGADGLGVATWRAEVPPDPEVVDATACTAVTTWSIGGATGVAATDGAAVTFWTLSAATLGSPADAGFALAGDVRLAPGDETFAAASVGDTSLQVLGERGVSALAVGGAIADVLAVPDDWRVALSDLAVARDLDGDDLALAATPIRMLRSDLDGDGADDLAVLEDGQVEVFFADGTAATVAAPAGATLLASGPVDADACPDLLVDDPTAPALQVLLVTGCAVVTDEDGDGSPAEVDCDDTDADVHPGAAESCDGADDDCDGAIDEPTLTFDVETPVLEGDAILAWVVPSDCEEPLTVAIEPPDTALLSCVVDGVEIACTALDDGEVELRASATDGSGTVVASTSATITIQNVAPSFTIPAAFASGLWMCVGDDYTGDFAATDPGQDTLGFEVSGEPDWFRVSPDGTLAVNARDDGTWSIEVACTDDDGGRTTAELSLLVDRCGDTGGSDTAGATSYQGGCDNDPAEDHGSSCGGDYGCCGSSGMAASALLVLVGVRRRREPAPRSPRRPRRDGGGALEAPGPAAT